MSGHSGKCDQPLVLAPILGVTDAVYRNSFGKCHPGFDRAIAPYIRPKRGQPLRRSELAQLAPEANRHMPTVPQILCKDVESFRSALEELARSGHAEVNWNLGCPTRNVAGRGMGSGLLPHPEAIHGILTEVLPSAPLRLSIKLRLGYRDPDEYRAVFEVLNRHPLSEVILHARTADQMYRGACDVARARDALTRCAHPFIYNGDIRDAAGFDQLREKLQGAAGWMIGRGALTNPALPGLLKGGDWPEDMRTRLQCFHDELLAGYGDRLSGPGHLLDWMKGQWGYLAHAFEDTTAVTQRIRRARDAASYVAAVRWVLAQPLAHKEN